MAVNLKEHIKEINGDFTELMYAKYLQGEWGISVGYIVPDWSTTILRKEVADWQWYQDCGNLLCALSASGTTTITSYPTWGHSPYPQIPDREGCLESGVFGGVPAVPETVQIVVPPINILQYEVGTTGGPVAGLSVFTPLNSAGSPVLINMTVDIALGAFLEAGVDYTFNPITGTINLLLGRLFNLGEVYTVIFY